MMDAKTAVELLLNRCSAPFKGDYINLFSVEETKFIADFIESQGRELSQLREQRKAEIKMRLLAAKIKKGEMVIPSDAIVFTDTAESIEQNMKECDKWEQYAELGQLALEDFKEHMANIRDFTDKFEAKSKFIAKRNEVYNLERDELLLGEQCK